MSVEPGPNPQQPVILVLRPEHQASSTLSALQQKNWRTVHFPTITISDSPELDKQYISTKLDHANWVFFISRNAVNYFLKHFSTELLTSCKVAAVGNATARALEQANIKVTLKPSASFTSEALLESPMLNNLRNQQVVIIRGNGGREHLAESLKARGAEVEYAELYQREIANQDCKRLLKHWPEINIILATSNELLDNLLLLCRDTFGETLCKKTLLVISDRMAAHANKIGFQSIWQAPTASDKAVIETIQKNTPLMH